MAVDGSVSNPTPAGGETLEGILATVSIHIYYGGGGTSLSISSVFLKLDNITRSIPGSFGMDGDPSLGGYPWIINPAAGVTLYATGNPINLNTVFGDTGGDDYSWYFTGLGILTPGNIVVRWNAGNNGPFLFTSGDSSPNKPTTPTPSDTDTGIVLLPTLSWQAG